MSDFEAATKAANKKLLSYEARDLNSSFSRSLPGAFAGDAVGSPKQRKSREDRAASSDGKKDFENGYVSRSDATGSAGASPPATNVHNLPSLSLMLFVPKVRSSWCYCYWQGHAQRAQSPLEQQQQQQQIGATGFALQLVQRGLEESLGAVQRAIHEEVQNLHLELLRQFHTQQVSRLFSPGLEPSNHLCLLITYCKYMAECKCYNPVH